MPQKIGLALGSGAARGWAHIGVLEALGKLGIVPDIVCGTSIGALVGAAFVTGRLGAPKSRIEAFGRREVVMMLDLKFSKGGLIEGKRIENFLEGLGIAGSIEELGCRFATVATDLESGREAWFQTGPIGRAVRASIGTPGVFAPTLDGECWLVDGGLVNPVPVSLARALGADIVIAVDLNSELLGRRSFATEASPAPALPAPIPQWLKDLATPILARALEAEPTSPSYFEVLANSLNIMEDRITRARLAGDPADVLLRPMLGQFDWLDFHRAKDAIAQGIACVELATSMIRHACRRTHVAQSGATERHATG
jgi:NTE family protein